MGQEVQFLTGMGGVPAPAVRAQLARILESPGFARAPRLKRFLAHCVEAALEGRAEALKEYSLGVDVFDRGGAFDPSADPIVRVDARRLRERLSGYYADEGAGDPVEIVLQAGGYAPLFRLRSGGRDAAAHGGVRLAVAPFASAPDDEAARRFGDGLTDELMLTLAGRPALRVIATRRVADGTADRMALAAELDAPFILTGKVQREGASVRVRAALTAAADGAQLWADRYDARLDDVDDVVRLQDDLAHRIAELVTPWLAAEPPPERRRAPTRDMEAYELYLRGRHQLQAFRLDSIAEAFGLLQAAVTRDPGFADALAAMSDAHFTSFLMIMARPKEALAASRRMAEAALAVDGRLAAAHAYLARVSAALEFDFAAAEAGFNRALAIDPTSATARRARAVWLLSPLGRTAEAEAELGVLLDQDPYALRIRFDYARVLANRGRFEESIRHLELILEFQPNYPTAWWALAFLYERVGRLDLARPAHERHVRQIPHPLTAKWLEAAQAGWDGDRARQRAIVEAMDAEALPAGASPGVLANAWIRAGEPERAVGWLERLVDDRGMRAAHLAVDPDWYCLAGEPRFQRLLQRMGLGGVLRPAA